MAHTSAAAGRYAGAFWIIGPVSLSSYTSLIGPGQHCRVPPISRRQPSGGIAAVGEELHRRRTKTGGREHQTVGAPAFGSDQGDAREALAVADEERQIVPVGARLPAFESIEHDQQ